MIDHPRITKKQGTRHFTDAMPLKGYVCAMRPTDHLEDLASLARTPDFCLRDILTTGR
jgi:hypothetical protein